LGQAKAMVKYRTECVSGPRRTDYTDENRPSFSYIPSAFVIALIT
jgi:hypothetical protein